jgi:hypothetical protein
MEAISVSDPTRAQAAATAFSHVSVMGIGTSEPAASIVAQTPCGPHDTLGGGDCASLGLADGEIVATAADVADLAGVGEGAGLAQAAAKSTATVVTIGAQIAVRALLVIDLPVLAFGRITTPSVYEGARRRPCRD